MIIPQFLLHIWT